MKTHDEQRDIIEQLYLQAINSFMKGAKSYMIDIDKLNEYLSCPRRCELLYTAPHAGGVMFETIKPASVVYWVNTYVYSDLEWHIGTDFCQEDEDVVNVETTLREHKGTSTIVLFKTKLKHCEGINSLCVSKHSSVRRATTGDKGTFQVCDGGCNPDGNEDKRAKFEVVNVLEVDEDGNVLSSENQTGLEENWKPWTFQ